MVRLALAAAAAFAGSALAAPVVDLVKRANLDVAILQFALTLEHLENVFYKEALKNYTLSDFEQAGKSFTIVFHRRQANAKSQATLPITTTTSTTSPMTSRPMLLLSLLPSRPPVPSQCRLAPTASHLPMCTLTYDLTSSYCSNVVYRPSFVTLSAILENVGTSAYLGAAPLISSPAYLTVAGSILAVEALHTSYQRTAIGEIPMANPFETVSPGHCRLSKKKCC